MRKNVSHWRKRAMLATLLSCGLLAAGTSARGAQQSAPDNSKTNQGDRDKSAVTADLQRMSAQDRELTRKIRAAITTDRSPSTYAHNVKIISRNGKVMLKGPVRSAEERAAVLSTANGIAGDGNVISEMEIAPPKF